VAIFNFLESEAISNQRNGLYNSKRLKIIQIYWAKTNIGSIYENGFLTFSRRTIIAEAININLLEEKTYFNCKYNKKKQKMISNQFF